MRFDPLIAAVIVFSACTPAMAESQDGASLPQFSTTETRTVGRNELLRALIKSDPWLVRQILDALTERSANNSDEFVARALDGINRAKNPDIVSSTRTAAASIEWINLLHRAREESEAIGNKPKHEPNPHSAKGSIELIEVLKQAKKEKERAK
jgi:hypothetical protein